MNVKVSEIIGFDLGHGETAVAKAPAQSIESPQMLEVNHKKNQITALGWHPELGYLVGEQALIQAGVTQLKIAFKQKPDEDLNSRETMRRFLETYYRLLKESKQIEGGTDSYFYVGCPSGWTLDDREKYQHLLESTGIPLLSVVPESRAAFMQAKEVGKFGYDQLKSSVLIVDIGSSTTDFTLVKSFHEIPLDFGSNALGASLIDKAIFARTLANHEQKVLLEKVFAEYPHHQARCELACRKAKEDYFSNEQIYSDSQSFARGFESINEQIFFIPKVNRQIITEILNQPLPELENKSWQESYRQAVNEAKEKLEKLGVTPKVLLMTGGASRMSFTRQICEEIFPEPETQVRPDPEPERCIALGLARVGRWELRASAFKAEVDKLYDSHQMKEAIARNIPELIKLITQPLSIALVENAVKPGLKNWKNGQIRTLADLESWMKSQAEQWLKSDRGRQLIDNKCVTWFNSSIQPEIAERTDPICRQFQIPRSSLRLESGIDPTLVNPDLPIGDAILADAVAFTINLVIGSGTLGSIIALLLTGHLIVPIALVYGAALVGGGVGLNREKIEDAIKEKLDIPSWIRFVALGDKTIDSICDKMQPELESSLREKMTQERQAFDELIEKIGHQVKKALHTKAEEVTILIQ